MRKHRCPGGVKVARFPGMSEVSSSISVSGHCFLLIFGIEFNLSVSGHCLSYNIVHLGDLACCIHLVFTMLFIFVKRMFS